MNKTLTTVVVLLAAGVVLFASQSDLDNTNSPNPNSTTTGLITLPEFSLPAIEFIPIDDSLIRAEVWQTFESYLNFAGNHNLEGLRSVSYQISNSCNDPEQQQECVRLMDSVHAIGSEFKLEDFSNVETDGRQIIMYTNGSKVSILYFIREEDGAPKLLGIQFCTEVEGLEPCVETDPNKIDLNQNGWWDSIESLFYENR